MVGVGGILVRNFVVCSTGLVPISGVNSIFCIYVFNQLGVLCCNDIKVPMS